MIKKSLFKKITALALATCLATSPAVIYAADDAAVRVVVVRTDTIPETDVKSDIDGIPELVEDDFKVKQIGRAHV